MREYKGDSRLRENDIKKDYFQPFEISPHISTFGRKSNKVDPTDFRFISASALRGFSKFSRKNGKELLDSAAWAADEVYGSLKAYYDEEY